MLSTLCSTVNRLSTRIETEASTSGLSPDKLPSLSAAPETPGDGRKSAMSVNEIGVLDQLVSRIEHLSSGVANIDATRQLREDNLLLRKDLQQYRDRELMLLSRMEALEKKIGSPKKEVPPPRGRSKETAQRNRSLSRTSSGGNGRSRQSSVVSEKSLPPIEGKEKVKHTKTKPQTPPAAIIAASEVETVPKPPDKKKAININVDFHTGGGDEGPKAVVTSPQPPEDQQASKQPVSVKQPLQTKKGASLLRKTSNGSSSSSSSSDDQSKSKRKEDVKAKKAPTKAVSSPRIEADSLQSEIQVARADNSILRQDIQVFRERESQLYRRNVELEERLIETNKEVTELAKSFRATTPGVNKEEGDKASEEAKEVNINVDFHTDDPPKAVFTEGKKEEEKVKTSDQGKGNKAVKSREPSKDRKKAVSREPSKDSKPGSKKTSAATSSKSGSSSSESDQEKKGGTRKPSKSSDTEAKGKGKAGSKAGSRAPSKERTAEPTATTAEVVQGGKAQLMEGEDWKVTIQSEHQLETVADTPGKTITVTPKPREKAKTEEAAAVKKAAAKGKKSEAKKGLRDPRSDPIPKPPQ